MAISRTYRLNASQEQLMRRLDEVVRARGVERVGKDEQVALVRDGDKFRILLGRGEPDNPASGLRGSISERDGQLHLEVRSTLAGLRPDGTRAAASELLEWAIAVLGLLAIVLAAGRLTGEYAISTIGRWLALYLAIVGFRFTRRALRRRRDRAELLSLIESAAGPLAALPEASPFRGQSSPRSDDGDR
jgi:hypothetical protein